jgi:hypothetical protein
MLRGLSIISNPTEFGTGGNQFLLEVRFLGGRRLLKKNSLVKMPNS